MALGLMPFSDNSFLTHLATGRLIIDLGHVPASDPYTFTAHGHGWVVQSWLVSLLFGGADQLAGIGGVRVVVAALTAAVFAVVWRLTRPAKGLVVRVAIAGLAIGVGTQEWSERPLLVGLIALGLTVLAAEGELDPRWLVPVAWVWVNSHGSFPIGVAYLLVVAVGRRLDHLDASVELRALRWLALGIVLGAANPVGPKLLLFPVSLLRRQDVLHHIIEWQAPGFQIVGQRIFLVQLFVAVVAVARRPRYRNALVVGVFLVAGLLGARNLGVASIVFVPVLAEAWPNVGSLRSDTRDIAARLLAVAGVAGLVIVPITQLSRPAFDLAGYPTHAIELLDERDVDLEAVRMIAPDTVGNLLDLRFGSGRRVFFDDRFDMYPASVADDAFDLAGGRPSSLDILDAWHADLVLWQKEGALTAILDASARWRTIPVGDDDWVLMCRDGASLGGELGTC